MSTLTKEYFDEQMKLFMDKLDSLVEINQRLIDQNISMTINASNTTTEVVSTSPVNKIDKKKLFYSNSNGNTVITGPGTFDVKDKLKENGFMWMGSSKSWRNAEIVDDITTIFLGIELKD